MDVFVYGTLTNPQQVERVVDSYVFVGSAVLHGLHPVEGRYPTLAPGGDVAGRVLRTDDVDALDRYEGVGRGLYVRVPVPWTGLDRTDDDSETVAVYVGDPDRLDVTEPIEWPGTGSFVERVEAYVANGDVSIRAVD